MKICILTPRFPYPQLGGDTLRINEVARFLKSQGHKLILASMSDDEHPDIEPASKLYDKIYFVKRKKIVSFFYAAKYFICGKPMQCGYYHSKSFSNLFEEIRKIENPDMYISHLLRMVPYLSAAGLQQQSIVEMTDALSKTYGLSSKAGGVGILKYIYKAEHRLIKKYECEVISSFRKVVLVSQQDVDFLIEQGCNPKSLYVHTNGVDHMAEISESYDPNKICFVGNMRSMQNQDAAIFFIKDVFPIIKRHNPNAKFYLVGYIPDNSKIDVDSMDIIATGFVEDLESVISDSCLTVAPVRVAAGIQNKVLIAMGCGVPVVLTSLISKAIPELEDEKNCIIADQKEEIANACLKLMADKSLRNRIAISGYDMVCSHYSWEEKLSGYMDL